MSLYTQGVLSKLGTAWDTVISQFFLCSWNKNKQFKRESMGQSIFEQHSNSVLQANLEVTDAGLGFQVILTPSS